jgi:fumarate reductase subunit D
MARSNEPLWWGPFSAGMMVGALCVPALIVLTGFVLPFAQPGPVSAARVQALASAPLTRLFLTIVISLSLFHFAHRFRYVIFDLGVKGGKGIIAFLLYGFAIVFTIITIGVALGRF